MSSSSHLTLWFRQTLGCLAAVALIGSFASDVNARSGVLFGQQEVPADRLVILAPAGPVIADVHTCVGRSTRSYREWIGFKLAYQMDVDRSELLSPEELALIPAEFLSIMSLNSVDELREKLASSGPTLNGEVPWKQLAELISQSLPRAFDIYAEAVRPSEGVRLAGLIDVNDDGLVSAEELTQGAEMLRFRDLDDDQTYSVSELLPYRDPRTEDADISPDAADLPFVQILDDRTVQLAVERVLKRYGRDGSRIAESVLRRPGSAVSESTAELNAEELSEAIKSMPPHLSLTVTLSDRTSASRIDFQLADGVDAFCRPNQTRGSALDLIIDGTLMQIRSKGGSSSSRFDVRQFLGQRFLLADGDQDNLMTVEEFPAFQSFMEEISVSAGFEDMDQNKDMMLTREEIQSYFERKTLGDQSKVEVSVRQDGTTLFSVMDQNSDRRLTRREFLEGFERLRRHDVNNDNRVAEAELGTEYIVTIQLGRPPSAREAGMMNMMQTSTDAILPGLDALSGPEWFRRMDRNQDGDLSEREFLGTAAQFKMLDSDADGLISADEALIAEQE